jgi:hypothetical protein
MWVRMAALLVGLLLAADAHAAGRWVVVAADGHRLGGSFGGPEYHDSEHACLAYKDGVVERARQVAARGTGASTSPLAEIWATARCVPE